MCIRDRDGDVVEDSPFFIQLISGVEQECRACGMEMQMCNLDVYKRQAIGCVKGFNESRIKVPDEISVIGFDNIFVSALIDPPLTTIAQPVRKMGQAAAEILISTLQGKKTQNKVVFEGKLIVRETT